MVAGIAIAGLVYFAPHGGDFLKFLPIDTSQTAQDSEQQEKDPKQQNSENQTATKQEKKDTTQTPVQEEITLRMRFINGTLYVGNWPCPNKNALDKTIQKLLTKYANKDVRIKYYKDGKDPYKASYSAQKLLKKAGFHVTVHAGGSE